MPSIHSKSFQYLTPEIWFQRKFQNLKVHAPTRHVMVMRNATHLLSGERKLTLGTMCSGSEAPTLWFLAFVRVLKSEMHGVAIDSAQANPFTSFHHKLACEWIARKQGWILLGFDPEILIADIFTIGRRYAYCVKADAEVEVPYCDATFAGTSCKDFSNLKSGDKSEVFDTTSSGSSSKTFCGYESYILRHCAIVCNLCF